MIHFFSTRRCIPDVGTMPDLSTPRSRLDKNSRAVGITPFTAPMSSGGDAEDSRPSSMMTTVSDGEVTVSSWSEKTKKIELGDA